MNNVCAWCGKELGEPGSQDGDGLPITHGICESCLTALWADVGTPVEEFLSALPVPAMLVSDDGRVEGANPKALGMVGKGSEDVEGRFQGEVFECVNAQLPGGCGHTVKCSACNVRNAVTETYLTGKSLVRIPSILKVQPDGAPERISFYLTTKKVGEKVLVRIEPAEIDE